MARLVTTEPIALADAGGSAVTDDSRVRRKELRYQRHRGYGCRDELQFVVDGAVADRSVTQK